MTEAGASRASPGQILATLAALAPDSQPAVEIKVSKDDTVPAPLSYLAVFQGHSGATMDPEGRQALVDPFLAEDIETPDEEIPAIPEIEIPAKPSAKAAAIFWLPFPGAAPASDSPRATCAASGRRSGSAAGATPR